MPAVNTCACKGVRSCLLCEKSGDSTENKNEYVSLPRYIYCTRCRKAYPERLQRHTEHSSHQKVAIEFPGIDILEDFVSETEEMELVTEISQSTWVVSQSGRRKQDFGPKVNFKKKRLRTTMFTGLPKYSEFLVRRIQSTLSDFIPIELCNLEYTPERGSAIDPHYDDFWLWGERLVTLNMMSGTFLTFTRPLGGDAANGFGSHKREACYESNVLDADNDESDVVIGCMSDYDRHNSSSHAHNDRLMDGIYPPVSPPTGGSDVEVAVFMPRRSLIVVAGSARYTWHHAIHRRDITALRMATTLRELTPEFMEGGTRAEEGLALMEVAMSFSGTAVS